MTAKWQRWKGIMKCYPFEEKRLAKWEPPYIIQPKYDGVRCRAVPLQNGDYLLLSSEENPIFSVPHINEELKSLVPKRELDGELYCHGMSFENIVSITSRTVNIHPAHEDIKFHIFDIADETLTQNIRTLLVQDMQTLDLKTVRISPFWVCGSLDEILKAYDILIERGYEGIIVRHATAFYTRKRSTFVMKFKPKKEDTYVIEGYQEEMSIEGNPKGSLGALVCRSGDGGSFRVGTGFSAGDRQVLWENRETLLGKVARIKYQHLTSGKRVPRFPVFVEVIDANS